MPNHTISPHEALEVHELLTFKNVCATKSATMAGLVRDEELRNILQSDFNVSQTHIRELQNMLSSASWSTSANSGGPTGSKSH